MRCTGDARPRRDRALRWAFSRSASASPRSPRRCPPRAATRGIGPNFMPAWSPRLIVLLGALARCTRRSPAAGATPTTRASGERLPRQAVPLGHRGAVRAHGADRLGRLRHRRRRCSSRASRAASAAGAGCATSPSGSCSRSAVFLFFVQAPRTSICRPAGSRRSWAEQAPDGDADALLARLRRRAAADEPAVGLHRRHAGHASSACCPASGPALTVAMLLPLTVKLDPTGALIMFAGIYYGAMFGGSTTTILLNTPGESASIATALEGNRMAKAGRAGPALATSAHRLVRRRHASRPSLLTLLAPLVVELALQVRPGRILRADGVRLHHRVGGARRVDGARPGEPLPRPVPRPDRHRQPDRPGALRLRRAGAARRHRRRGARGRPVRGRRGALRRGLPEPARRRRSRSSRARSGCRARTGSARGRRGCARPRSAFRSARFPRAARRSRRSSPTRSRRSSPSIPRSSATARSRASPGPKPPTTPRRPARWCRC